ncbi:MAG: hypothetical protein K2Z81_23610, partial [Cyanobacteria bacterium]|nr:hypothetical protein [Cyanobacteriota bacterium]
ERADLHRKFALMMLSRLQAMKPPGPPMAISSTTSYSASELHAESVALENEFEELQSKFQKLGALKKHLPASGTHRRGKSERL